jgi:serine/threonine protein phosphatase PrpC
MTEFVAPVKNYRLAVAHEAMNPRKRSTMEDVHRVVEALGEDPSLSYFAVYDGHGGRKIVDYLEPHLEKNVAAELKMTDDASIEERLTRYCTF